MSSPAEARAPGLVSSGVPANEFDELLGQETPPAPLVRESAGSHPPHEADHLPHDHVAMPTWDEFVAGWDLGLYQDPILCGVLAGLVLGVLGVFVVLRRAVFVTAAVSQSAGLGVALAFLLQVRFDVALHPVLGAFALALLATALLAGRFERFRLPKETLLGFTYIGASAAAILVGDRITQEAHDVSAILFGTAVLVRPVDLSLVAIVGALVLLVLGLAYRGLVFAGFDAEGARVQGVPVRFLDLLLWVLVAAEVSVATRAIGALPVFAFAVLPAMAALSVVERLRSVLVMAAALGALAGGLGYLFAFFLEFPVGASQACLATLMFLACLPLSRRSRRERG
ncbi:MAG TPA: metal ABC transporter permease [Polyangiaceae bacterium]